MTDSRKPRRNRDPIEHTIEVALNPGSFISDRACFSFVSDRRDLSTTIAKLVEADPLRAVEIHETFLAGCDEKAEEIDDSSGSFGQFVSELHCAWIRARQAAGAAADETAVRLLAWMDDDPYGFCGQLEKDAARVLDKDGRAALEKLIRARFDAGATEKPTALGNIARATGRWSTPRAEEMMKPDRTRRGIRSLGVALSDYMHSAS